MRQLLRDFRNVSVGGLLVVSFVDNLAKPYLTKGRMDVHGGVLFFALLGGLAPFGPSGLLAGPLIVAFFWPSCGYDAAKSLRSQRVARRSDPAAGRLSTASRCWTTQERTAVSQRNCSLVAHALLNGSMRCSAQGAASSVPP